MTSPPRHAGFRRVLPLAAGAVLILLALACTGGDRAGHPAPPRAGAVKAVILAIGNVLVEVDLAKAGPAFGSAGLAHACPRESWLAWDVRFLGSERTAPAE
jgi:hypothetical protein